MDRVADNRSLGELLSELSRETATLIRQEATLAKTELTRNLTRIGRHAGLIVGGGALLYAGLLAMVGALVLLLVRAGLAPWLAAAIAGGGLLVVGYALLQSGLSALRRDPVAPDTTVETLKENAQWAKNQLK